MICLKECQCANSERESKKTVLITGGAGFIGSNLINALIKKKHDVVLCDYPELVKKNYFSNYNRW